MGGDGVERDAAGRARGDVTVSDKSSLWPQDDAEFLLMFRRRVDDFLVLGFVPSDGSPGRGLSQRAEMRQRLGSDKHDLLRRSIAEMRPYAKELTARAGAPAILVQYPPPAIGGPVIELHIFDAVTNTLMRSIPKEQVLDVIDYIIGAVKSGMLRARAAEEREPAAPMLVKDSPSSRCPCFQKIPLLRTFTMRSRKWLKVWASPPNASMTPPPTNA